MAQKSLTADRSAVLALPPGGSGLGGGADIHLPVIASSGGYDLRALVGFTIPASFWTGMRKITKVELRLTGTAAPGGGAHLAIGASPQSVIRRIIASWVANSAGESWSTSPTVYPGPSTTTSGGVTAALPTSSGGQLYIDITSIGMAWAPNSVLGPSGAPGGGAVCYGVALLETGGASNAAEVVSAKGSTTAWRPTLRFTYDTNARPTAPTLIRPLGPDQLADTFEAQGIDPEGDPIIGYDLQVTTDPTFTVADMWNIGNQTIGLTAAGHIERSYGGTPLVNGDRYYWRALLRDAGGFGAWSGVGTFVKGAGSGPADMYDAWAQAILEDMAEGRTVLRIGALRPVDEQVAQLVCAEFGDLMRVKWDETVPQVDEPVYLLGERVSLDPNGWVVEAIVERKREVT